MTALLSAQNIHKSYASVEVLKGVSLELNRGDIKVILGPSGSGKSTLLRCLGLLEPVNGGNVAIEGVDCSWRAQDRGSRSGAFASKLVRQRPNLAFVFQNFNLFPHLTALENVSLGPRIVLGRDPREAREKARAHLEDVGLAHRLESYPHQLSGGQQQRVAIARGLAMDPALLLLDEPTAALDAELTVEVLEVLLKLATRGVTMLAVTHALQFARRAASELIVMDDGAIVEFGTTEELFTRPRHERTRKFLEMINH
ncbi:MAG: amino acid ABC transporter ATP-binding protein [Variibacter sp.]